MPRAADRDIWPKLDTQPVATDAGSQTTVVIPVWDEYVSKRLAAALESVASQAAESPIVVVDNASSTPLPRLPGARVVRSPERLTLGRARNLGLTHVTTPYVVFWDADDVMLPGALAALETGIEDDPGLAAFAMAILEQPDRTRHRWPRRWVKLLARRPAAFALLDAVWSLYPSTGATIMPTELVREAGGYGDADSGEDWCLGVSLAFRGRIRWSEQPGRLYRVHPTSLWSQNMTPKDLVRHASAVRQRIRTDKGIPDRARTALPLIWGAQWAAIAVHLALETARRGLAAARNRHGGDPGRQPA